MLKFVLGMLENIVEKGENASNQHFLKVVKSQDCVVKV